MIVGICNLSIFSYEVIGGSIRSSFITHNFTAYLIALKIFCVMRRVRSQGMLFFKILKNFPKIIEKGIS